MGNYLLEIVGTISNAHICSYTTVLWWCQVRVTGYAVVTQRELENTITESLGAAALPDFCTLSVAEG